MKTHKLALNRVYNVECLGFMERMPRSSINLVVTSPPYNCGINYDVYNDNMKRKDYLLWCYNWLKGIKRVLKLDGRFAINLLLEAEITEQGKRKRVSPHAEFISLIKKVGLRYHGTVIWVEKTRAKMTAWGSWKSASCPFIYCPYEVILFGYKKYWKKTKKGKSTISKKDFIEGCSGIWDFSSVRGLTKACFPERLPELCIRLLSYKNDIVFDPFSGSGTTGLVAEQLGRRWIATELSKNYYQISKKRILAFRELEKLRLFRGGMK